MRAAERFALRVDEELALVDLAKARKVLRPLSGPMGPTAVLDGREHVVLCSNDYLGLASHPAVVHAGAEGLARYGAGTASVRFICGTLDAHVELEAALAGLVGTEAALTYVSGWSANEALLPTVVADGDTIVSDELNHASIIDAARLTRGAERIVYPHGDVAALEAALERAAGPGVRWVVTDGVFSMEGDVAPMAELVEVCRRHDALLVVDDSHGVGVMGRTGRGTHEHADVLGEVDVLTGTLGKALGGAAGGYVAGSARLVDLLTQRSRPSLFSNALPATVACSARKAIEILVAEPERLDRLHANAGRLRAGLEGLGFSCGEGPSPIIPIHLGDEVTAAKHASRLAELGVLIVAFSFPVVPRGAARLRIQASAALDDHHIATALAAFARL